MQNRKHITSLKRVIAILLLLLFCCLHLLQGFHSNSSCADTGDGEQNEQQYMSSVEHCKICDYLAHMRHDLFYISHPIVLSVPLPKAIELNGQLFARIYKFTLQGFTNKGPPSFA
jgi:hypothetical protein